MNCGLAAVKVESNCERQPLAFRNGAAMHALDFDDGADRAGLLDGDVLNCAEEFFARDGGFRIGGGAVLKDADQLGGAGDGFAADGDGVDDFGSG